VRRPDLIAKMFGVGLGLAILIDVLTVRLVIAPAVVTLLGERLVASGLARPPVAGRVARGAPRPRAR
jgi:uncharacterized membrane protein YdfJ with MMPL/SSD domain